MGYYGRYCLVILLTLLSFIGFGQHFSRVGPVAMPVQTGGGGGGTGTVSFVNEASSLAMGTTSLSVPLPPSRVVGNIMVMIVVNKYPPNGGTVTPTGWSTFTNNQAENSGLTAGAANGNTRTTVFYRIIDGSESGNVSVTMTSANVSIGWILQFSKSAGTWAVAGATGADNTHNGTTSFDLNTDPGFTTGDMAVMAAAINMTTGVAVLGESATLTVPGITAWSAQSGNTDNSTTGDDIRLFYLYKGVTTGTSSGIPSYSHTITQNSATSMVLVRLRAQL